MRYAIVVLGALSCAAPQGRNVPVIPGGSVADFDRGLSAESAETGTPAGARDTIGAFGYDLVVERAVPLPEEPPIAALLQGSPDDVRRLQRSLAERGYYHGTINGHADTALREALSRYRADQGLPRATRSANSASRK